MKRLLPILFLAVMFVRHYESQGVPVPNAQVQYFGNTGAPLASGQLFSYISSSSTPTPTYTSSSLGVQNSNPVVLDISGRANVWLGNQTYRLVLEDSLGNTLWDVSGVPGNNAATVTWTRTAPYIYPANSGDSLVIGGTTAAPLAGSTPLIVAAAGTKFVASNALSTSGAQQLLDMFVTNNASVIDSTNVGTSTLPLDIQFNENTKVRYQTSGNTSFGTTTDNGYKVDVQGTLNVTGQTTLNSITYAWPTTNNNGGYFLQSAGTSGVLSWVAAGTAATGGWSYSSPVISLATLTDRVILGATTSDAVASGGIVAISAFPSAGTFGITSATTNGSTLGLDYTAGFVNLRSGHSGSGTTRPLRVMTDANETARFQTSGNVCIGCTADAGFKLDVNGTFRATAVTDTALSSTAGAVVRNNASQVLVSDGNLIFNANNDLLITSSASAAMIQIGQSAGGNESSIALLQPGSGTTHATITTNLNGPAVLNDLSFLGLNGGDFGLTAHGNYNFGSTVTTTTDANAGEWTLILKSLTAPTGNPQSGAYFLYVDPADNKLKAKGSSGTVTILALP